MQSLKPMTKLNLSLGLGTVILAIFATWQYILFAILASYAFITSILNDSLMSILGILFIISVNSIKLLIHANAIPKLATKLQFLIIAIIMPLLAAFGMRNTFHTKTLISIISATLVLILITELISKTVPLSHKPFSKTTIISNLLFAGTSLTIILIQLFSNKYTDDPIQQFLMCYIVAMLCICLAILCVMYKEDVRR